MGGTLVDTFTVTPQADSVDLTALAQPVELYSAAPPAEAHSDIKVSKDKILSDGVDQSKITFTVADDADRPVSGIADKITLVAVDNGGTPETNIQFGDITEEGTSGVYTSWVSGDVAGKFKGQYRVVPRIEGKQWRIAAPFELLGIEFASATNANGTVLPFPKNIGFPSSSFLNAEFTLTLSENVDPNDYEWTSSVDWLALKEQAASSSFPKRPKVGRV